MRCKIKQLFGSRRYLAFWLSQVTSHLGNGLTLIALAAQVIPARGATQYGLVLACDAAAMSIFMLGGGVLADRYSRTLVMAVADLACVVGVFGYLTFGADGPLWLLLASSALIGAGVGLFEPAHRSALPQMVPEEHRQLANSIDSGTKRLAAAAGAGLGGLLMIVASPTTAYLIDIGTFLLSAVALLWIALPAVDRAEEEQASWWADIKGGFREVSSRPWVAALMLQGTVQMLLVYAPAYALIPIVAQSRYSSGAYGLLMAAQFVGAMIGSALGAVLKARRPGVLATHCLFPSVAVPLCIAFPAPLWLFVAVSVVAWAGISVFLVLWYTALQNQIPEDKQGRVFALEGIASFGLEPIALALAPAIALAIGFTTVGIIGAAVLVVSTYAVLLVRRVPSLGAVRVGDPMVEGAS